MAQRRKRKRNKGIGGTIMKVGVMAAGGFAGNQVTGFIERMAPEQFAPFAPVGTVALGFSAANALPKDFADVGTGMAVVGSVELAEKLMNEFLAPATEAQSTVHRARGAVRSGYTPRWVAEGKKVVRSNDGAVIN